MVLPKPPYTFRLLSAADLHLGRGFASVLGEAHKQNFIFNAWENLIALASTSGVDAVLLAGDIFDSEDNLYEAVFHFEKGVVELSKRGIPVIAVAGNHDARLFAMRSYFPHLPRFHCLGKNGNWETYYLDWGQRKLRIDGWSFPDERFAGNPLKSAPLCSREEIAIGLLHCECPGQKESYYAPVSTSDFAASGHRAWILGHIHIPHTIVTQPDVFYCGSLQGLDSSEHGPRGATILDIDTAGQVQRQFCPLAPLLWHRKEIEIDSSHDLRVTLENSVQETFKKELSSSRAITASFILQGRVHDYKALAARAKELEGTHLTSFLGTQGLVPCWIEKITVDCQPAFDLALLAQGEDMVSQLARLLLTLQKKENDTHLLGRARDSLEKKLMKYPHLADTLSEEELRRECLRSGYSLLADLMKQKETL